MKNNNNNSKSTRKVGKPTAGRMTIEATIKYAEGPAADINVPVEDTILLTQIAAPLASAVNPSAPAGPNITIEMIPVTQIKLDPSYNKPDDTYNSQKHRNICGEFNRQKGQAILVNERDDEPGYYYVLDGKAWALSAIENGEKEVPAKVLHGLTRKDEAAYYQERDLNCVLITPIQKIRSGLVAKDPIAMECEEMAARFKAYFDKPSENRNIKLGAPGTFYNIIASPAGKAAMFWTLFVMTMAKWLNAENSDVRVATSAVFYRSFYAIFPEVFSDEKHRMANTSYLIRQLSKTSAKRISDYADLHYWQMNKTGAVTATLLDLLHKDITGDEI